MNMPHAFIASPSDLFALTRYLQDTLKDEAIICSSSADLPLLAQAESVYFVVSQVSMCSTSFQQLVLEALHLVEESHCKLLRLDDVQIPIGFSRLQSLPVSDV
jgi:hypothetical protein